MIYWCRPRSISMAILIFVVVNCSMFVDKKWSDLLRWPKLDVDWKLLVFYVFVVFDVCEFENLWFIDVVRNWFRWNMIISHVCQITGKIIKWKAPFNVPWPLFHRHSCPIQFVNEVSWYTCFQFHNHQALPPLIGAFHFTIFGFHILEKNYRTATGQCSLRLDKKKELSSNKFEPEQITTMNDERRRRRRQRRFWRRSWPLPMLRYRFQPSIEAALNS